MKLWLLRQDVNSGYDTYDSAVVIAETEEDARKVVPGGFWLNHTTEGDGLPWEWYPPTRKDSWTSPENIQVTYLGEATPEYQGSPMVVCASFNAG